MWKIIVGKFVVFLFVIVPPSPQIDNDLEEGSCICRVRLWYLVPEEAQETSFAIYHIGCSNLSGG